MGIVVICSYRPKAGGEDKLIALLRRHYEALRTEELATARAPVYLKSSDGAFLEIFEWRSEEASRGAHENPVIGPIWSAMAEVCEFVPMASLEQCKTPFAHFEPFEL